jgi:hypothetical protein
MAAMHTYTNTYQLGDEKRELFGHKFIQRKTHLLATCWVVIFFFQVPRTAMWMKKGGFVHSIMYSSKENTYLHNFLNESLVLSLGW